MKTINNNVGCGFSQMLSKIFKHSKKVNQRKDSIYEEEIKDQSTEGKDKMISPGGSLEFITTYEDKPLEFITTYKEEPVDFITTYDDRALKFITEYKPQEDEFITVYEDPNSKIDFITVYDQ
eukprot:NODE_435_length_7481_cov_1.616364.p7 type:complete len:122 gc:universal NODE_435_length_7481_cov_1.616364:1559-1194(-)